MQEPTTTPPGHPPPPPQPPPAAGDPSPDLVARLTRLGIDAASATQLAGEHPPGRIVDVLDAAEAERPRSPAGWVVAALRGGWDVHAAAAQTRDERARRERRDRHEAERDRALQHADERDRRADGWAAAVSDALDDDQLTVAIRGVTRPLPTVGRRPAPMVRTQLIAWAAATSAAAPSQPLAAALEAALATAGVSDPPLLSGDLPVPPPRCRGHPLPLEPRIAACLRHLDRLERQEAS